jgi:hypothetical protein
MLARRRQRGVRNRSVAIIVKSTAAVRSPWSLPTNSQLFLPPVPVARSAATLRFGSKLGGAASDSIAVVWSQRPRDPDR